MSMNNCKFTHKGLLYGIVPVFLDMKDEDCPTIAGRNLLCDVLWFFVEPIFAMATFLRSVIDPSYQPSFPIKITEIINGEL